MWQEKDKQLYRKFEFNDFNEAFEFMTKVAELAKAHNHHPKWTNSFKTVEIWLSTHSEGQVTDKDRQLAKAIDGLFDQPTTPKLDEAKLYTDGGSRGNPGDSACAYVICKMDDIVVEKSGFYLGIATNNQAEYQALTHGLQAAAKLGVKTLNVFMDSELVVKQMKGEYKVKHEQMKPLYVQAQQELKSFEAVSFIHVPRAMNAEADKEVNRILDEQQKTA